MYGPLSCSQFWPSPLAHAGCSQSEDCFYLTSPIWLMRKGKLLVRQVGPWSKARRGPEVWKTSQSQGLCCPPLPSYPTQSCATVLREPACPSSSNSKLSGAGWSRTPPGTLYPKSWAQAWGGRRKPASSGSPSKVLLSGVGESGKDR